MPPFSLSGTESDGIRDGIIIEQAAAAIMVDNSKKDRDIVVSARLQRRIDERITDTLRGLAIVEDRRDLMIADHAVQSVGTEQ